MPSLFSNRSEHARFKFCPREIFYELNHNQFNRLQKIKECRFLQKPEIGKNNNNFPRGILNKPKMWYKKI